jgi:hypothetical protein
MELAASGDSGRNYVEIVGELIEQDPATRSAGVEAMLARTGGYQVYALLGERVPEMDEDLRRERFALMTSFVIGSVARRVRAQNSGPGARESPLSDERFVVNLVTMAAAMLTAPLVATDL